MGKTSSTVKNRYNEKAYDRLAITIPKGSKEEIEKRAKAEGLSLNGYVNKAIEEKMQVESLKQFSVRITEREHIIDAVTMQPMDDKGLQALDGISRKTITVSAHSKEEAEEIAQDQYISSPASNRRDDSVEFDAKEL